MAALYGDDGEMQCAECGLDFRRQPADEIEARWRLINMRRLASEQPRAAPLKDPSASLPAGLKDLERAAAPRSPRAHELLKRGGEWLGAARSWIQWHCRNGSEVEWGSGDVLVPALSVRDVEEIAAEAVAAFLAAQRPPKALASPPSASAVPATTYCLAKHPMEESLKCGHVAGHDGGHASYRAGDLPVTWPAVPATQMGAAAPQGPVHVWVMGEADHRRRTLCGKPAVQGMVGCDIGVEDDWLMVTCDDCDRERASSEAPSAVPAVPALPSGARQQEEQTASRAASAASPAVSAEDVRVILDCRHGDVRGHPPCVLCRPRAVLLFSAIRAAHAAAYARGLERAADYVEHRVSDGWFTRRHVAAGIRALLGSVATEPKAPPSPSGALAGAEEMTTKEKK